MRGASCPFPAQWLRGTTGLGALPLRDIAKFLLLFAFWIILSERMQLRYLAIGAASSLAVTLITRNIGLRRSYYGSRGKVDGFRFVFAYIPWLVWQVILANLQVASLVMRRELRLDPVVLELPLKLQSKTARVVYANSITLTPGTVTVDVGADALLVHALTEASGEGLLSPDMHNRVASAFMDELLDNDADAIVRQTFARHWVEGEKS